MMIWSRLSLTGKLLAAVVMPVLLAVLLMAGTMGLNMRDGFGRFLLETEAAQFDHLAESIATDREADIGWPRLRHFPNWVVFIREHRPILTPGRRSPDGGARPDLGHGVERPLPALPLPNRLALISLDGDLLAGRGGGSLWVDVPVRDVLGEDLAILRLFAPDVPSSVPGRVFLEQQLRGIAVVAAIALVCASAVAFLTARQFLSPIHRIGEHVARLAAGDLSSRLVAGRRDELGRMIQDQNALAESLESSRARERQWVSDTSHELKTPLSVLRAEIEAMQDGIRVASPETLDPMHQAVMRLSRLVDDLRLLANGDEARLDLRRGPVDLGDLTRAACGDAQTSGLPDGLDLVVDVISGVIVLGDEGRLRQVLDNLLSNACRYTDAPGQIAVTCRRDGAYGVLCVEDTAPCPSPPSLPGLFDRFSRGETSRSRDHGGSGLGLSICQSMVTAHGGRIEATPSPLGGLRLRVLLPLLSMPTQEVIDD